MAVVCRTSSKPPAKESPRALRLTAHRQVTMQVFGNVITRHSFHHSVCIDLPTLVTTGGREFPQQSVRPWALLQSARLTHSFPEVFSNQSSAARARWQPGWCGPGGQVLTQLCPWNHVWQCPVCWPVFCFCASCLWVRSQQLWALCEFLRIVWDSSRLTSLGCGHSASCLQVNTEENGLVQPCVMLEGHDWREKRAWAWYTLFDCKFPPLLTWQSVQLPHEPQVQCVTAWFTVYLFSHVKSQYTTEALRTECLHCDHTLDLRFGSLNMWHHTYSVQSTCAFKSTRA